MNKIINNNTNITINNILKKLVMDTLKENMFSNMNVFVPASYIFIRGVFAIVDDIWSFIQLLRKKGNIFIDKPVMDFDSGPESELESDSGSSSETDSMTDLSSINTDDNYYNVLSDKSESSESSEKSESSLKLVNNSTKKRKLK